MVFPIAGGNESKGYDVENSLRFNAGDSPYLSFTLGTPTNDKIYTWSYWVKRGNISTSNHATIFGHGTNDGSAPFIHHAFETDDELRFDSYDNETTSVASVKPSMLFRDPSAWYHIIYAFDTTQSTASNRLKIYVNGNQITDLATTTYPAQNKVLAVNKSGVNFVIGEYDTYGSNYLDAYLAEINFVDGQQLSPTDFGEFNDSGVWIPKKYTGTYGNNGVFLEFKQTGTSANSSGIGADTSGNDNHFAVSGIAATDVTEDTCTNNFCTLNPVDKDGHTNAEGNLEVSGNVVYGMQRGTIGASSGKWYFEARLDVYQNDTAIALANENENIFTRFSGETTNSVGYLADGRFFYNGSATSYSSLSAGNIFQIAFDADSGKIWIGKNNTWQNSGDPANGTGQVQTVSWNFFLPTARTVNNNGNGQLHFNFGQDSSFSGASTAQNNTDGKYGDFYYAPPSGFYALCTKRLAEFG